MSGKAKTKTAAAKSAEKTAVKKNAARKNVKVKAAEKKPINTKSNIERICESSLPSEFVNSHHGEWNHQDWLDFCARLDREGFTPVDLDQVGLLLEDLKAKYHQKQN